MTLSETQDNQPYIETINIKEISTASETSTISVNLRVSSATASKFNKKIADLSIQY